MPDFNNKDRSSFPLYGTRDAIQYQPGYPNHHLKMPPKPTVEPKVLLGRPSNNLKMGIVGLPNVGKSSFFNALTSSAAKAENFPFCTIDPEESRVAVPDARFDWLCSKYKPASKVPAYLTVIDIAGLVRGASAGQGLGNAFLSHIRAVDGIFHMVRAFSDEEVVHVEGDIDPIRDIDIISEELRLKDVEFVKKALEQQRKVCRSDATKDKSKLAELELLERLEKLLETDKKQVRFGEWTGKDVDILNTFQLLTAKPVIFLVNISEDEFARKKNKWLAKIKAHIDANFPGETLIPFSCSLENRLMSFEKADADAYLRDLATSTGVPSVTSALPKIIVSGYQCLNLIYYFTAGADEVRAWTIRRGCKAPQAAGTIHTDFERGFIMAECMHYADLHEADGDEAAVRAAGKYQQKGKEYVVEDGDVLFFKFNVTASKKK